MHEMINKLLKRTHIKSTSDPVLSPYPLLCYYADRDPTIDEPLIYSDYPGLYYIWINTINNTVWVSFDNTTAAMVWRRMAAYKTEGVATLSLGSATIDCTTIVSGDQIQLSYQSPSGVVGALFVASVTAGTGFVINSTSLLDSSIVNWKILN